MRLLLVFIFLQWSANTLLAQEECQKFKVVAVYDFPASPQTPGGDDILVLLTVKEDLDTGFDPFYSTLFFLNEQGDTITVPIEGGYTLPTTVQDTIPYIMELVGNINNQDFPTDFNGYLVVSTINVAPFPNPTVCQVPYTNLPISTGVLYPTTTKVKVFPNPWLENLTIEAGETIEQILIYDLMGKEVNYWLEGKDAKTISLRLANSSPKVLYLSIQLESGEIVFHQIVKMNP